jgi:SAM-dependent methyltransferase
MDLVERHVDGARPRHPWETARAEFFLRVLEGAGLPAVGGRVLDVGSGDGWFAGLLADAAGLTVTCWDTGYADHAPPVHPRLRCTAVEPEGRFDLVMAMDVAEHVEDDRAFVGALVGRQLAPGGHLLLAVPAWPALFSEHDRFLRHVRRYTPAAGRALLEGAGLEVVRAGGLFHSILLPRAAQALLERRRGARGAHAGEWRGSPAATRVVHALLSLETRGSLLLSRVGWELPGLSWWALCKRR